MDIVRQTQTACEKADINTGGKAFLKTVMLHVFKNALKDFISWDFHGPRSWELFSLFIDVETEVRSVVFYT